jgi:hypothetical protein
VRTTAFPVALALLLGLALPAFGTHPCVPVAADEPLPGDSVLFEEEAALTGEAKAAYEADLKKFEKRYTTEIKNRDELLQMLNELEASGSRAARDWLIQFARKVKSAEYRARAFEALVKIGGKASLGLLCGKDGLRAPDFKVQTQAAAALAKSADKRCVPALLDALGDPAVKMETIATLCLTVGKVGPADAKVEETLVRLAADKRDTVRAAAVEALGYVKNDKAFGLVLSTLQKEKNATVRAGAAKGLGHAGRQEAIPALKAAVATEKSQPVREAALAALKDLGATPD